MHSQGIPSIIVVRTTDVSYMIVAGKVTEGTFKQKTRIKLPLSSISSTFSLYCRAAPNNTIVEWEETSQMAVFIFLVDYCPIINTKLSQLGSVSSRFLKEYPYLICR